MTIPLIKEDPDVSRMYGMLENCCFCKTPTAFWYEKKNVACCEKCAKVHKVSEVPTRKKWIEESRKAY